MNQFTVTRVGDVQFSVTSNIALSDHTYRADGDMRLTGNVLRSHEQRGHFRVGGLLTLNLGPASLAKVTALSVGESVVL